MPRPGSSYSRIAPSVLAGLFAASDTVRASQALSQTLVVLVFVRASQLNGCGFCLEMHLFEALHAGETHERRVPVHRMDHLVHGAVAFPEILVREAEGNVENNLCLMEGMQNLVVPARG